MQMRQTHRCRLVLHLPQLRHQPKLPLRHSLCLLRATRTTPPTPATTASTQVCTGRRVRACCRGGCRGPARAVLAFCSAQNHLLNTCVSTHARACAVHACVLHNAHAHCAFRWQASAINRFLAGSDSFGGDASRQPSHLPKKTGGILRWCTLRSALLLQLTV